MAYPDFQVDVASELPEPDSGDDVTSRSFEKIEIYRPEKSFLIWFWNCIQLFSNNILKLFELSHFLALKLQNYKFI